MTPVVELDVSAWRPDITAAASERHARVLESGGVLVLPRLAFALRDDETRFLDVRWSDGKAKNISLDGASIKGNQIWQANPTFSNNGRIPWFGTVTGRIGVTFVPAAMFYAKAGVAFLDHDYSRDQWSVALATGGASGERRGYCVHGASEGGPEQHVGLTRAKERARETCTPAWD